MKIFMVLLGFGFGLRWRRKRGALDVLGLYRIV